MSGLYYNNHDHSHPGPYPHTLRQFMRGFGRDAVFPATSSV
ncbi:hypothetical protein PC116_g462 [Phytophthora cactorum]|uniref:Uncharacterized protein n=1 Tax=Phytophthora cactorum TaxID=29920 RepID=A0A8T1ELR4_9STRA|nr:hypothetical protein PC117_g1 [Phytophthora cactorum]KAG3192910.1 hypothetical protein C6341_g357 [Phytophthora cactorum]KAG3207377.1 hypothetical protein PC128_g134 [Phytophthora cactorum]KAG4051270.1 hypothetical protein PC123_g13499 [Phytophthora cactorum]KAG4251925.1 hypothetical protein PC116_g462 [Phytophthora cactorum]